MSPNRVVITEPLAPDTVVSAVRQERTVQITMTTDVAWAVGLLTVFGAVIAAHTLCAWIADGWYRFTQQWFRATSRRV